MKHRTKYQPAALLEKYKIIRDQISDKEFFCSPKHQKTQEIWCAAHFSRAYERYLAPSYVLIDDSDIQTEVDFDLEVANIAHPFQVTEAMEPGRRRGDEYRYSSPVDARHDDIESGAEQGAWWIRAAIEKKLDKHYAGSSELNLLVYLNFAGRDQKFNHLRATCQDVARQFASVWLLNGNALCCIQPNPRIHSLENWLVIEES